MECSEYGREKILLHYHPPPRWTLVPTPGAFVVNLTLIELQERVTRIGNGNISIK